MLKGSREKKIDDYLVNRERHRETDRHRETERGRERGREVQRE